MMGSGYGMFGGLGMIVFWVILIVLVVLLVRSIAGGWPSRPASQPPPTGPAALDILQARYAKGEISKEEYEERKKTLAE